MEDFNIVFISKCENVKDKIKEIKDLLNEKHINCNILLYTNNEKCNYKDAVFVNASKKNLYNIVVKTVDGDLLLADLDCDVNIIFEHIMLIINNIENNEIVSLKVKENKFTKFFNRIKFFMINLCSKIYKGYGLKNINGDFQYLKSNVVATLRECKGRKNILRTSDAIIGYNHKIVTATSKLPKDKFTKFNFFALIFDLLVILNLAFITYFSIVFNKIEHFGPMLLLLIILLIVLLIFSSVMMFIDEYKKRK